MERRLYTAVDAARLIFAACIVAIHTHFSEALSEDAGFWLQQGFFRLAVPFFFVTSGFFLMEKIRSKGDAPGVIRTYVMRLIVPFIVCDVLNAVMNVIYNYMTQDTELRYAVIAVVSKGIWYPYGAMWYVAALIIGALMLLPFLKAEPRRLGAALGIGIVLFAFALLCNNYFFIAEGTTLAGVLTGYMDTFVSARNGVFVGFFLLAAGMKASEINSKRIEKAIHGPERGSGTGMTAVICVILFAAYIGEIATLRGKAYLDDRSLYISQIFFVAALLLLLVGISKKPSADPERAKAERESSVLMRKMSVWIYFSHRFILITIEIVFVVIGKELPGQIIMFVIVTALSVLTFFVQRKIRIQRQIRQDGIRGGHQNPSADHSLF